MISILRSSVALAGLLIVSGCASETKSLPPPSAEEGLKELVNVFRYLEYSKLPLPRKPDDFNDYIDSMPNALERIKQGEFIVAWGVGLAAAPGAAQQVLAYEKKAPSEGGAVLLRDGTVKHLTPAEFSAASRPK